ncbi:MULTISPECIES: WxL domain-containing protein [unclassified Lactococcus]|uniref:WxL domain-containing protein n=1 Tax=unclassified Lactococcus TaxID=2643510 RepID=UPI0016509AA3|nr:MULTISPECIES: WxL domain-containing protein [unclassified Lactococcus]
MSISKRKVVTVSASLLLLWALGTPHLAHASTSAVVATTPQTLTLTGSYLTIDGATNWNFPTRQIQPNAMNILASASLDTWTAGTVGTSLSTPDAIDANSGITSTDFPAAQGYFATTPPEMDGVQVSDYRGTDAGWSLYATSTDLISNKGYHMTGSSIIITAGQPTNAALDGGTNYIEAKEGASVGSNLKPLLTGMNPYAGTSGTGAPTANSTVGPAVLIATTGTAQALPQLNATGTTQIPFNAVTLNMPTGAGMAADTYNANITWSLTMTP